MSQHEAAMGLAYTAYWCHRCYERYDHEDLPHEVADFKVVRFAEDVVWEEYAVWDEETDEAMKVSSAPSKIQAKVFQDALALPPGSMGSLPPEVHTLWKSISSGPETIPQRHALRNMIVTKNAPYGHICRVDPDGRLMQRIRKVFEVKQRNQQMVGLTESEMLHKEWQGNIQGMQKAIEKQDIVVKDGFCYWKRGTHEHITGGKQTFHFDGGDPRIMSQEDSGNMMSLY